MKFLLLSSLLVFISCTSHHHDPSPTAAATPKTIEEAVASDMRTPENKQRDQYRHPVETLKFFGVEPTMTVVEINPGSGWYMEILAPYLAEKGRYISASAPAVKDYAIANEKKISEWRAKYPEVSAKMETVVFNPPSNIQMPPDGTADLVLTFRNVHNWVAAKGEKQAFKSFYKVLRPGGILGVVEHRAGEKHHDPLAKSGYMKESYVIAMARKAGFRLIAVSQINANPKDTKDHPEGVWTLPPTLRLGDKDKDKYLVIGESDRMTLKFEKPKN